MPSAVLHLAGDAAQGMRAEVVAALASAGVDVVAPRAGMAPAARLLCFARPDEALYDRVTDMTGDGVARLLAVALEPCADTRVTWTLLQRGATDVIIWRDARACARDIAARLDRWSTVDAVVASDVVRHNLIGRSPAWQRAIRDIAEIAVFTESPLLLDGETGTGKELVARLIHTLDRRDGKRDLVLIDCTTLVPALSGSELFGHERGAFTGAVSSRDGACALANGGTLFLDEIGELPLSLQAELLRVVQEGTYKRVGSNSWQKTRFRLVCATHRKLSDEVQRGAFRRDLFYRIAGVTCTLPALAERPEDIIPLAEHFVEQARPDLATAGVAMDDTVREFLLRRPYPGNVRDLRQLVARMVNRHPGSGHLSAGDIPHDERPRAITDIADWRGDAFAQGIRSALAAGAGLREISGAASDLAIQIALAESVSVRNAARRLGVSARALQLRRAGERSNGTARGRSRR